MNAFTKLQIPNLLKITSDLLQEFCCTRFIFSTLNYMNLLHLQLQTIRFNRFFLKFNWNLTSVTSLQRLQFTNNLVTIEIINCKYLRIPEMFTVSQFELFSWRCKKCSFCTIQACDFFHFLIINIMIMTSHKLEVFYFYPVTVTLATPLIIQPHWSEKSRPNNAGFTQHANIMILKILENYAKCWKLGIGVFHSRGCDDSKKYGLACTLKIDIF